MSDLTDAANRAAGATDLRGYLYDHADRIAVHLDDYMEPDAFIESAMEEIEQSPDLQNCTSASILGAIAHAAQLRLQFGSHLGYMYLGHKVADGVLHAIPITGYQGYVELAYRTGRVEKVEAFFVRKGDDWKTWADSRRGRQFRHVPKDLEDTRDIEHAVALAKISGGECLWASLTREQLETRAPTNRTYGPWKTNPEFMHLKNAIRAMRPYLPKSPQFAAAFRADEQVVRAIDGLSNLVVGDAEQQEV